MTVEAFFCAPGRFRFAVLITFCALCLSGCGDGRLATYPVQGQLKFEDGTTPMFGNIEFYNAQHKLNARGKVNKDGTFTVGTYEDSDGAVEGEHKIVVQQHTGSYLAGHVKVPIKHDHGELIHSDYFDYRTSDLKCNIKKGKQNPVELVLRKNPRQTEEGLPED